MISKNIKRISGLVIILLVVLGGIFFYTQRPTSTKENPPNIIFILTDDLDFPLMPYMENTNKLIGDQGATFTNYFVTSSACCPSRASTLRGQYPHNTGILENSPGFEQFYRNGNDETTIATWMKNAGYKNSYLGKYMNLYPAGVKRTYIPPGWADWHVFLDEGESFYFAYSMNENGKLVRYQKKAEDYSTDVIKNRAMEFIDKYSNKRSPFFIFISLYAPHGPSDPAPRHRNIHTDLIYPKSQSFHEEDTSDKPLIIRDLRRTGGIFEIEESDALFVKRVQSMLAVDEMVAELVQLLDANGQLDNTYIIFTSDNGFHMGEHSLPSGKMLPYEEDIHVPLLIRGPNIRPGTIVNEMASNIDIAPTIVELAGAQIADFVDGRSFAPFLYATGQQPTIWRQALLIETGNLERESPVIAYRGVRTGEFIYIEYENGELEFYDLIADPYQLENLASKLDTETISTLHFWLEELKTCKADECRSTERARPDISY
ncbi:MAG TPA: sulfatase [Anaerolineales bacterium]|nr:sulfatase [Anaerolineales bacterium]